MTQGTLLDITLPSGWAWEPLGYLAPRVSNAGRGDLEPLSVYLGAGVVRRADREDNHNVLGADLDKYLHVQPGDLVFNKLRTWQGGLGASRYEGVVSPAYYVLRSGPKIEPRFANYVLLSSPYLAELTRLSKFMPPSQFDMPWESLMRLPMLLPPIDEQRRIADFLDDQVGRIDQAIELKKAELALLQELHSAQCESFMQEVGERVPLKYHTSKIGSGKTPRGGADVYVSSGVIFLRSQNVHDSGLDLRDVVFIDSEADEEMAHTRVRAGDVLLNITGGSLGRVAVAPKDLGAANVSQHVCIIRPRDSHLSELIAASLRTPAVRSQIDTLQVGGNREGLNFEQVGNLIVNVPSEDVSLVLKSLANLQGGFAQVSTELSASITLCEERKRSLITAAVTGQMDVTAARPLTGPWVAASQSTNLETTPEPVGMSL